MISFNDCPNLLGKGFFLIIVLYLMVLLLLLLLLIVTIFLKLWCRIILLLSFFGLQAYATNQVQIYMHLFSHILTISNLIYLKR